MGEREHTAYLEPTDQLRIAARVNRICSEEVNNLTPEEVAQNASEIVKALDPIMHLSDFRFKTKWGKPPSPKNNLLAATSAGNFSVPLEPADQLRKTVIGNVEIYRIGGYIARKSKGRSGLMCMYFDPFFGAGGANYALENFPTRTQIDYDPKSLEVASVATHEAEVSHIKKWGRPITKVDYKTDKLYFKNEGYYRRKGIGIMPEDTRTSGEKVADRVIYTAAFVSGIALEAALIDEATVALLNLLSK